MADLILGTAGHIDHGKTSLVRALTGVDTDRLPEEKKRGITIDIGFAELELGEHRLGVVDVPGHERFVRNMLAGATGIDLALLVIAADDSIKPQTREHLEILKLLRLQHGVVAVTKSDLVDPDWLEMVIEEIRELLEGTFLESASIVPTSAETREGIEQLKAELILAADAACQSERMLRAVKPFRMPIDRVFTMAGHGAVVTGSVVSGSAEVGDVLVIQPGGDEVRIRGLQNHDQNLDQVTRGQRAAVNLAGVRHDHIVRGQELAAPGFLEPSQLLTVELNLLAETPRPLKDRSRVRLHLGSAQVLCTVRLLQEGPLEPGQTAFAQLALGEAVTSVWRQPYVLRSESPVVTLGGGNILSTDAERLKKPDDLDRAMLKQLASDDALSRASAAAFFFGLTPWAPIALARAAGVDDVQAAMDALLERGEIELIPLSVTRQQAIHRDVLNRIEQRVAKALGRMHDEVPLRSSFDRTQLAHEFDYLKNPALIEQLLRRMQRSKAILVSSRGVSLQGRGPKLSKNERALLEQIIDMYQNAGLESPTVKQCQDSVQKLKQSVPQLISLAAADGALVEVSSDYFIHRDAQDAAVETLREKMRSGDGLTLSEIREALETTRKYAVPFCEHLDRIGVTRRNGDLRVMAPTA
jgi:selenocysteine-specific elongation factor